MGVVKFYVPSELRYILHTDTMLPERKLFQFKLVQSAKYNGHIFPLQAGAEPSFTLALSCGLMDSTSKTPIMMAITYLPEETIGQLADAHTPAEVNQILLPYKEDIINYIVDKEDNQTNFSAFLSQARGYVFKNEPVALFEKGTLQIDPFNDVMLRLLLSESGGKTLLLATKEYIFRDNDILQLILFVDNKILQVYCTVQDALFCVQRIQTLDTCAYSQAFQQGASLTSIQRRIEGKPSQLQKLLKKSDTRL